MGFFVVLSAPEVAFCRQSCQLNNKGVVMEQISSENGQVIRTLLFEEHRFKIAKALAERPASTHILALETGIPKQKVGKHLMVLCKAGLVQRLPKGPSPFDPQKKAKYQEYEITPLGVELLKQYEKKPSGA
jgi:hypothetical protein